MKKLTIEITDLSALEDAYPEMILTKVIKTPDRSKLLQLVKVMRMMGREVAGVKAYYAKETPAEGASGMITLTAFDGEKITNSKYDLSAPAADKPLPDRDLSVIPLNQLAGKGV